MGESVTRRVAAAVRLAPLAAAAGLLAGCHLAPVAGPAAPADEGWYGTLERPSALSLDAAIARRPGFAPGTLVPLATPVAGEPATERPKGVSRLPRAVVPPPTAHALPPPADLEPVSVSVEPKLAAPRVELEREPEPDRPAMVARGLAPDTPRPVEYGLDGRLPSPIPKPKTKPAAPPPVPPARPVTPAAPVVVVGGVEITLPADAGKPPAPPAPSAVAVAPPKSPAEAAAVLFARKSEPPAAEPPRPLPPTAEPPVAPLPVDIPVPVPSAAPNLPPAPPPGVVSGPVIVGGQPVPFDSLSSLVDGGSGAGCSSCGGGIGDGCPPGRPCTPGNKKCEPFPSKTAAGRIFGGLYECLCCPDPCYQPKWEPIANASFYVEGARPVTQTTVRWDHFMHVTLPDRGEFFLARSDGNGKGPKANPPALGIPFVDAHDLVLRTEVGSGMAGFVVVTPYRSINPYEYAGSAAGFGDIMLAPKTLLYDTELFQFAFQFNTYLPVGNFRKGLGTGHVSLEPTLIAGFRAGPKTFLQAQLSEWIPLGGDQDYQGALLRYNFSINHVLWQPVKGFQVIGTLEATGYSFQDGAYTEPTLGPGQKLSGQSFYSMGAGTRLCYCDRFDFGIAYLSGVTGRAFADSQFRFEVRYRY